MEAQLLSPAKKKRHKWRSSLKGLFRKDNDKQQRQQRQRLQAHQGQGDLKYFADIVDGALSDDQDHATANLSFSGSGSNPYSEGDDSCDGPVSSPRRMSRQYHLPQRSTTVAVAAAVAAATKSSLRPASFGKDKRVRLEEHMEIGQQQQQQQPSMYADVSFAQLRLSSMRAAMHRTPRFSSKMTDTSHASGDFDQYVHSQHGRSPARSGSGSSGLWHDEDAFSRHGGLQRLDSTDLGMEVIMFDHTDDDVDDVQNGGIFLSFQSPTASIDGGSNPFPNTPNRRPHSLHRRDVVPTTPPRSNSEPTFGSPLQKQQQRQSSPSSSQVLHWQGVHDEYVMPEALTSSPCLSQLSESVTWVSHDEDGDERPVKEIIFPILDDSHHGPSLDDVSLDNELEAAMVPPNVKRRTAHSSTAMVEHRAPAGSIRDAIFAQLDQETVVQSVAQSFAPLVPPPPLTLAAAAASSAHKRASLRRKTSSGSNMSSSQVTPNGTSKSGGTMALTSILGAPGAAQLPPPPPLLPAPHASPSTSKSLKSVSTAFLKRKSAFTGEDLLFVEAESFAEFLEVGEPTDYDPDMEPTPPPSPHSTARKTSGAASSSSTLALMVPPPQQQQLQQPRPLARPMPPPQRAISTEERLLIALTASLDSADPIDLIPLQRFAATTERERGTEMAAAAVAGTSSSASHSMTSSSVATSAELFSKSLSYDPSFGLEEESTSYASSSLAHDNRPPSLPGSLHYTTPRRNRRRPSHQKGATSGAANNYRSRAAAESPASSGMLQQQQQHYCGGIFDDPEPHEDDIFDIDDEEEDEDDDDDELTLRSEDFLPQPPLPSPSKHSPSRSTSSNRRRHRPSNSRYENDNGHTHRDSHRESYNDTTPLLLDQVGKDLLETVQDLAREGSSAVLRFLRR